MLSQKPLGPSPARVLLAILLAACFSIRDGAALALTGTPGTQVKVGQAYSFTPTVSGPYAGKLFLSLKGAKPDWATFSANSGTLSGTPQKAGVWPGLQIVAWDGTNYRNIAFTITVIPGTALNIAGTPIASAGVGQYYSFKPTVVAAAGAKLAYQIGGKPAWAAFDSSSGLLAGTPATANIAAYAGISISVSDGHTRAALPVFKIVVAPHAAGTATLSWTRPTHNTDGSVLTNLAGYRVVFGSSAAALSKSLAINSAAATSAMIENLAAGNWYFAVASITTGGIESALSAVISKAVL